MPYHRRGNTLPEGNIGSFLDDQDGSAIVQTIAQRSVIPVQASHANNHLHSSMAGSFGTSRLVHGSDFTQNGSLPEVISDESDTMSDSASSSSGARLLDHTLRPAYVPDGANPEVPLFPPLRTPQIPFLQCPFGILGCNWRRPMDHFNNWIAHSFQHFVVDGRHVEPPQRNRCCFCEHESHHPNGVASWNQRMQHTAQHHGAGHSLAHARPDFELLRHLWQNDVISQISYRDLVGTTPNQSQNVAGMASPPMTEAGDGESDNETVVVVNEERHNRRRHPGI